MNLRYCNLLKNFTTPLLDQKNNPAAGAAKDFSELCKFYERDLESTNTKMLNT